jgi:hypothetical protein
VRELFWREWVPIGVNGAAGAEDEYDWYADKAYVMLMSEGRTAKEIERYLYHISGEHMGMGESPRLRELAAEIATKLVALKPTFESESDEPF